MQGPKSEKYDWGAVNSDLTGRYTCASRRSASQTYRMQIEAQHQRVSTKTGCDRVTPGCCTYFYATCVFSAVTFDPTIVYASRMIHDSNLSYEDRGTASAKQPNSDGSRDADMSYDT